MSFQKNGFSNAFIVQRFWRVLQVGICWVAFYGHAYAIMEMTEEEYALLPEYCHHKKWVSAKHPEPQRSEKWESFFGKDFLPVHHYCWALVKLGRASRARVPEHERRFNLKEADGNVNFVLVNTGPSFPLRAELYTKQLEIRTLLRDEKGAEEAYSQALEADPTFWRAYWVRAYWLFKRDKAQEAMKVVQQGLKQVPDSAMLNALLEEMRSARKSGGK